MLKGGCLVQKDSPLYTFAFALVICLVCSLSLALVAKGLQSKQELNEALDVKKNILKAVSLTTPLGVEASAEDIVKTYEEKIQEIVIDGKGGVVEGKLPIDIKEGEDLYPIYIYSENKVPVAYAFPIIGKGLWSTLYGYFALETDAKTVRGITFYKHGETPGLGAEIEKDWFQNNFKGKSIWNIGKNDLQPIEVIKGKVSDKYTGDAGQYYVDGISGATMTAKGVTEMLDKWLHMYEPFFSQKRQKD